MFRERKTAMLMANLAFDKYHNNSQDCGYYGSEEDW